MTNTPISTSTGTPTSGVTDALTDVAAERAVSEFGWLLDNLVDAVPGMGHALLLASDGLALAASRNLDRDLRDQLAAPASMLVSTARAAGRSFGDDQECDAVLISMSACRLLLTRIDDTAALLTVTGLGCSTASAVAAMHQFAAAVGPRLSPPVRAALHRQLAAPPAGGR
jgi:predicted regulator of Ras-like GTPase activity (Roadblock/LC7/MglB family)